MAITYENVTPTLIANTTMKKVLDDGVHKTYYITPNEGYVLHDNTYDYTDQDGNAFLGYRETTAVCGASYDFAVNPRKFYAVLESEAEENVPIDADEATEADYQSALAEFGVRV